MSEFRVRASSWGSLFDCAHMWEGVHLLKMRMPSSGRAQLGTAIHAGTAEFDKAKTAGKPISAYDAAAAVVDAIWRPERDVVWDKDDLTQKDAERIGLELHSQYCSTISPQYTFAAVEMTTEPFSIDCGGGITITLTGTLDRSRIKITEGAGHAIADLKSGRAAVEKGKAKITGHRPQLGTYELLYEHTTGNTITEPAEIIGMKTAGTPVIATNIVPNAKQLMVGTPESPGLLEFAANMFRAGLFPPNPKTMLCSSKYCARWNSCPYHD